MIQLVISIFIIEILSQDNQYRHIAYVQEYTGLDIGISYNFIITTSIYK